MIKLGTGIVMLLALLGSARAGETRVLGGRPPGCPSVFCACVVSIHVFGRIIPRYNLSSNYVRDFRQVAPAPRMVAARSGHSFLLLYQVEGDVWHVLDGNTGNRKTGRHKVIEHDRSIRGFKIVNPHQPKRGERYATQRHGQHI